MPPSASEFHDRDEAALTEICSEGWCDAITNLEPAEASVVLARFVHDLVSLPFGSEKGDQSTVRYPQCKNAKGGTPIHVMIAS